MENKNGQGMESKMEPGMIRDVGFWGCVGILRNTSAVYNSNQKGLKDITRLKLWFPNHAI